MSIRSGIRIVHGVITEPQPSIITRPSLKPRTCVVQFIQPIMYEPSQKLDTQVRDTGYLATMIPNGNQEPHMALATSGRNHH